MSQQQQACSSKQGRVLTTTVPEYITWQTSSIASDPAYARGPPAPVSSNNPASNVSQERNFDEDLSFLVPFITMSKMNGEDVGVDAWIAEAIHEYFVKRGMFRAAYGMAQDLAGKEYEGMGRTELENKVKSRSVPWNDSERGLLFIWVKTHFANTAWPKAMRDYQIKQEELRRRRPAEGRSAGRQRTTTQERSRVASGGDIVADYHRPRTSSGGTRRSSGERADADVPSLGRSAKRGKHDSSTSRMAHIPHSTAQSSFRGYDGPKDIRTSDAANLAGEGYGLMSPPQTSFGLPTRSTPSTATTHSRPSTTTATAQSRPSTATIQSRPSTATTRSKTSTTTTQPRPSTATTLTRPTTSTTQSKPFTATTQSRSSTTTRKGNAPQDRPSRPRSQTTPESSYPSREEVEGFLFSVPESPELLSANLSNAHPSDIQSMQLDDNRFAYTLSHSESVSRPPLSGSFSDPVIFPSHSAPLPVSRLSVSDTLPSIASNLLPSEPNSLYPEQSDNIDNPPFMDSYRYPLSDFPAPSDSASAMNQGNQPNLTSTSKSNPAYPSFPLQQTQPDVHDLRAINSQLSNPNPDHFWDTFDPSLFPELNNQVGNVQPAQYTPSGTSVDPGLSTMGASSASDPIHFPMSHFNLPGVSSSSQNQQFLPQSQQESHPMQSQSELQSAGDHPFLSFDQQATQPFHSQQSHEYPSVPWQPSQHVPIQSSSQSGRGAMSNSEDFNAALQATYQQPIGQWQPDGW